MKQGLNKIRRQLLITLGALPITSWMKSSWSAKSQDLELAHSLTYVLTDLSSAQFIGALYIEAIPEEGNLKQLLNCVRHTDPELITHAQNNPTSLYKRIKFLQFNDFNEEHVVSIDGWVLSKTEARLCALTTFL